MPAQCTLLAPRTMELTTDLYAPRRKVIPEYRDIPLKSRAFSREVRCQPEARFPLSGVNPVDCTMLTGLPQVERSEGNAKIVLEGLSSILYYDENGMLQGSTCRSRAEAETGLSAPVTPEENPMGPVQWNLGGGNVTVRAECTIRVTSAEDTSLTAVTGAEISELLPRDPDVPSLRLRPMGKDETLWSLAKASGSTVDAIRKANGLTAAPEKGKLLIIPVL